MWDVRASVRLAAAASATAAAATRLLLSSCLCYTVVDAGFNKGSGQCQLNPMSGSCTPAKPSDCAAIPAANGSDWVWVNTSLWSWSYGCMARIRSELCDMVGKYGCPDDGKNDGHGEYLPRQGSVHGHTKTPEECIALGKQYNYTWVQWSAECYDPSEPDHELAICKADADPAQCAHCAGLPDPGPGTECKMKCQEARFVSRDSNCFAMKTFAAGCVWPGPWCYYEVDTARFTPKCGYLPCIATC
eukprot:COSAG05_NODE_17_length_35518_cov_34.728084_18_plen_245_part_00